jgi:hypothetical protein
MKNMLLTMDKRYNREFHRGDVILFKKGLCAAETGVAHKYYAYVGDSSPFAVLTTSNSNTLPGTTPVTEDMTAKLPDWIEVMVADDSFPAEEQVKVRLNPLYAHMLKK